MHDVCDFKLTQVDRGFNVDPSNNNKEGLSETDDSSDNSSLSDLKKRLQDLPSPNEATRLAGRVVATNRRLCRIREAYFHLQDATNRIDEKDEKDDKGERDERDKGEEKEQKDCVVSPLAKHFSEFEVKDARTRRRAGIRLRISKTENQNMVVSQPNSTDAAKSSIESKNEERSSHGENTEGESTERHVKSFRSSLIEGPRKYSQQFSPFLCKTPGTRSPYRSQDDDNKEHPFELQRNTSILRGHSSLSFEDPPNDRIELQSLSPISLCGTRPTKFGGYRPPSGVILKNFSSGSESDSNNEVTPKRATCAVRIDSTLVAGTPVVGTVGAFPVVSARSTDRIISTSVSQRSSISNNNTDCQFGDTPKNAGLEMVVVSPSRRVDGFAGKMQDLSGRSDSENSMDNFLVNSISSRSPIFQEATNEQRENNLKIYNCQTSRSSCAVSSTRNSCDAFVEETEEAHENVPSIERKIHSGSSVNSPVLSSPKFYRNVQENVEHSMSSMANEYFSHTEDYFLSEQPRSLASENSHENNPQINSTRSINSSMLMDTEYHPDVKNNNDYRISFSAPLSIRTANEDPENFISEGHSIRSTPKVLFERKLPEEHNKIMFSSSCTKQKDELLINCSEQSTLDSHIKDIADVPTLVLNSQEGSCSSSPDWKTYSGGRTLDTNALMAALSNISLKEKVTNESGVSRKKYTEFRDDSEVSSGPTSSKASSLAKNLCTSKSLRSKIPVKITECRNKVSLNSYKFIKAHEETVFVTDDAFTAKTDSIDTNSHVLSNISPLSGEFHLASEREDYVPRSPNLHAHLSPNKNDGASFVKLPSSMNGVLGELNSEIQSKYSDTGNNSDTPRNCSELGSFFGTTHFSPKYVDLSECLNSVKVNVSNHDENRFEYVQENGNGMFRATFSNSIQYPELHSGNTIDESSGREDDKHTDFSKPPISQRTIESSNFRNECNVARFVSKARSADSVPKPVYFQQSDNYTAIEIRSSCSGCKSPRFRNQFGDTNCQETIVEESRKSENIDEILSAHTKSQVEELFLDSSSEMEEVEKDRKSKINQQKLRFSMERLAAEQFRRHIYVEHAKTVHSENAGFLPQKVHTPSYPLKFSASTSKLHHPFVKNKDSPRFRKKSQDRFPFTISEKPSSVSMKFKLNSERGRSSEQSKSLERTYKLIMHPSITRLAGPDFEDMSTKISNSIAYCGEDDSSRAPGMKGFVRRFSAKLRKSKKRINEMKSSLESTSVIYKNRAYQGDSMTNSCSEASIVEDFKSSENLSKNQCVQNSPRGKPYTISEQNSPKQNHQLISNHQQPHRRYDRDDLWVQEFKDPDFNLENVDGKTETHRSIDNHASSLKDPYSLFLIKSESETQEVPGKMPSLKDKEDRIKCRTRKKRRIKILESIFPVVSSKSDENVHKETERKDDLMNSAEEEDMETGCLCSRLCPIITCLSMISMLGYQSPIIKNNTSSRINRRPRFSLRKRKG